MTIKEALKEVLNNALCHDGVARGLREGVKALDKYVSVAVCLSVFVVCVLFVFLSVSSSDISILSCL